MNRSERARQRRTARKLARMSTREEPGARAGRSIVERLEELLDDVMDEALAQRVIRSGKAEDEREHQRTMGQLTGLASAVALMRYGGQFDWDDRAKYAKARKHVLRLSKQRCDVMTSDD